MGEQPKTVKVSIDVGELVDSNQWSALRKDIDRDGAKGVGDGFGVITLRLNGQAAVILKVHEDQLGYVVVDVYDGRSTRKLTGVDVELYGFVPPRMGPKVQKERRFGDEPLGG